jgi:transcription initiation factor IIE alpha subunit
MAATTTISLDAYVMDVLLPDLVGHDRRPSAFLVYLLIASAGPGRRVALSHAQLAERTGLSRRSVQAAVALLHRRRLLEIVRRGATETAEYRALQPWRRPAEPQAEAGS